jgi:hypothetical protein
MYDKWRCSSIFNFAGFDSSNDVQWLTYAGVGKQPIADPVPPPPPEASQGPVDNQETINTPEDKELILGNRVMDPSVPAVWMIESRSVLSHTGVHALILLFISLLPMLLL